MKRITSKALCLYSLFVALAMMLSYIEAIFPLDFVALGIKLGFANLVSLYLILQNKRLAAVLINVIRVLLTALLFGNAFSLIFSLSAGMVSVFVMLLLSRSLKFGTIGISGIGGVFHNLTQLAVAILTVGKGVLFYAPLLVFAGVATGVLIGLLAHTLLKNKSLSIFLKNV